jgi:hypothetical protein
MTMVPQNNISHRQYAIILTIFLTPEVLNNLQPNQLKSDVC